MIKISPHGSGFTVDCPVGHPVDAAVRSAPSRKWIAERSVWWLPMSMAGDVARACVLANVSPDVCGLVMHHAERRAAMAYSKEASTLSDLSPAILSYGETTLRAAEAAGFSFKVPPMEHQLVGIYRFLFWPRMLLGDQMGVGKTKQAIDAARILMTLNEISRAVVVCPATLKYNWAAEILENAGDKAVVLDGTPAKREKLLVYARRARWVIMNYELVWRLKEFEDLCGDAMLIADEAHKLANPRSNQSKGFSVGARKARAVMPMTGTPITNKPEDIFALTYLVDPGVLGLHTFSFLNRFAIVANKRVRFRGGGGKTRVVKEVVGYRNLDEVRERIGPSYMRRLRSNCLSLPEKVRSKIRVAMSDDEQRAYATMIKELRAKLGDGDDFEVQAKGAAAMFVRLQQICDGFLSDGVKTAMFENASKLEALDEIVGDVVETSDESVVIFARFLPDVHELASRWAKKHRTVAVYGDVAHVDRQKAVDVFQAGEAKIFVAQIQTGGLGLTLTRASCVAFVSRWWAPYVNLQAEDRCYRKGLDHALNVVTLVASPGEILKKEFGDDVETVDAIVSRVESAKLALEGDIIGVDSAGLGGDFGALGLEEARRIVFGKGARK